MDPQERRHLEDLLEVQRQRLFALEKQAATFGAYAPPHVSIELEQARAELEQLQRQLGAAGENPAAEGTVTALFLAADPSDQARLRLGQELREIQEKLQLSRLREKFRLESRHSPRPQDLSQAMLDLNPQVVHFSGHGGQGGEIYLEDDLGNSKPVEPDALAALFGLFDKKVRCVVLNACYSEAQARAIARHVGCVVGMSGEIGDGAALAFSVGFYQAVGAGESYERAYQFGCVQIRLQGIPEHLTPVLLSDEGK